MCISRGRIRHYGSLVISHARGLNLGRVACVCSQVGFIAEAESTSIQIDRAELEVGSPEAEVRLFNIWLVGQAIARATRDVKIRVHTGVAIPLTVG